MAGRPVSVLNIAEKPSVAREVSRILNGGQLPPGRQSGCVPFASKQSGHLCASCRAPSFLLARAHARCATAALPAAPARRCTTLSAPSRDSRATCTLRRCLVRPSAALLASPLSSLAGADAPRARPPARVRVRLGVQELGLQRLWRAHQSSAAVCTSSRQAPALGADAAPRGSTRAVAHPVAGLRPRGRGDRRGGEARGVSGVSLHVTSLLRCR